MDTLNWFLEHSIEIAAVLSCVWSTLLVVVRLTPSKADDLALQHMEVLGSALYELLQTLQGGGEDEYESFEDDDDSVATDAD